MKIRPRIRSMLTLATTSVVAAGVLALPTTPSATADEPGEARTALLETYLADTWRSMDAMTDPATGLPADNIGGDLAAGTRSGYTSPTNIGAYIWSTVVARDAGLIS